MKCHNCLYETEQPISFCPKCGVQVAPAPQTEFVPPVNYAANRATALVRDKLFLAMCILISVSAVISFDVISILLTIFLWLTFAKSRKNIVDANHLRQISGTVYASYVLNNIASIILIVCGVIYSALMVYAIYNSSGGSGLIDTPLAFYIPKITKLLPIKELYPHYLTLGILVALGIAISVGGIISLLINLLGFRKIHRFVKSVHTGITSNNYELAYLNSVKGWLIFFAVLRCMGAVSVMGSGISAALASGSQAAAIIITVVLINKYLIPQKPVNMNIL